MENIQIQVQLIVYCAKKVNIQIFLDLLYENNVGLDFIRIKKDRIIEENNELLDIIALIAKCIHL